MAWTYNNVRIYVQEMEENTAQIIARLQPLAGTTVMQIFGDEAPIHKFSGKVVGEANLDLLKGLIDNGLPYVFSGVYFYKTLYLKGLSIKRDNSVEQTIDRTQSCYAPVYTVGLELYEE